MANRMDRMDARLDNVIVREMPPVECGLTLPYQRLSLPLGPFQLIILKVGSEETGSRDPIAIIFFTCNQSAAATNLPKYYIDLLQFAILSGIMISLQVTHSNRLQYQDSEAENSKLKALPNTAGKPKTKNKKRKKKNRNEV